MHIRDSHIQNKTSQRLKRRFAGPAEPLSGQPITTAIPEAPVSPHPPTTHRGTARPIQNDEEDTADVRNDIRDIIGYHTRMVDGDNLDNEAVSPPDTIGRLVTIQELFNFTSYTG